MKYAAATTSLMLRRTLIGFASQLNFFLDSKDENPYETGHRSIFTSNAVVTQLRLKRAQFPN